MQECQSNTLLYERVGFKVCKCKWLQPKLRMIPWRKSSNYSSFHIVCCSCCSVTKMCPALCDPVDCSMPGFPVLHYLLGFVQTHVHQVGDAIQTSYPLSPLLLLPSIFPSIWIFSNESIHYIRWPKNWSFSFSIRPSNEHSGLTSFRIDWFDFLGEGWGHYMCY